MGCHVTISDGRECNEACHTLTPGKIEHSRWSSQKYIASPYFHPSVTEKMREPILGGVVKTHGVGSYAQRPAREATHRPKSEEQCPRKTKLTSKTLRHSLWYARVMDDGPLYTMIDARPWQEPLSSPDTSCLRSDALGNSTCRLPHSPVAASGTPYPTTGQPGIHFFVHTSHCHRSSM